MATLEQILGFRNLSGVVQAIKSGVPNPFEGTGFMNPGRQFSGNKAEYYKITGTRRTARIVQYGSPAQRRELREIDLIPVTMAHTLESQQWPMAMMVALTHMTDLGHDAKAEQQAEYQSREFKRLFSNTRITMAAQALFQGKTYVKSTGDITANSSDSQYTINYQMAANNQNQLNGVIATTWAQATAQIITQLLVLNTTAAKLTGYPLEVAFYGDNVPGYIGRNTEAQQYLKLQPAMAQQYLTTGTIPNGFGGIKQWIRAGNTFFEDYNGTNQSIITADQVVFTPAPSPDWWEIFEGSYLVPNSIMPVMGADAAATLKNVTEMFGMFGYGLLNLNPTTVEQFAGDTFLPVLKVPNAVFQATVAF